ncbi:hypothetical protein RA263_27945, partial [Pseudomonas syringae pv. tagetis]
MARATGQSHYKPFAALPLAHVKKLGFALLELFLDLAGPPHTRMRLLRAEVAIDDVLGRLSTRLDST